MWHTTLQTDKPAQPAWTCSLGSRDSDDQEFNCIVYGYGEASTFSQKVVSPLSHTWTKTRGVPVKLLANRSLAESQSLEIPSVSLVAGWRWRIIEVRVPGESFIIWSPLPLVPAGHPSPDESSQVSWPGHSSILTALLTPSYLHSPVFSLWRWRNEMTKLLWFLGLNKNERFGSLTKNIFIQRVRRLQLLSCPLMIKIVLVLTGPLRSALWCGGRADACSRGVRLFVLGRVNKAGKTHKKRVLLLSC